MENPQALSSNVDNSREGGCLCGANRYRMTGKPFVAAVCHCTFCKRRFGSGFGMMVYVDEAAVEILQQGDTTEYQHHSDETGRYVRIRFCARCGTSFMHRAEFRPGMVAISAGTFDNPNWVKPQRHIWTRSKLPWITIPDGLPSFSKAPS